MNYHKKRAIAFLVASTFPFLAILICVGLLYSRVGAFGLTLLAIGVIATVSFLVWSALAFLTRTRCIVCDDRAMWFDMSATHRTGCKECEGKQARLFSEEVNRGLSTKNPRPRIAIRVPQDQIPSSTFSEDRTRVWSGSTQSALKKKPLEKIRVDPPEPLPQPVFVSAKTLPKSLR